jgi:hypothetical protein
VDRFDSIRDVRHGCWASLKFNNGRQASCTRLVAENWFGGLENALLEVIGEVGKVGDGNKIY